MRSDRRGFVLTTASLGAATLLNSERFTRAGEEPKGQSEDKQPEAEISAPEDLMREHGVLNRILLIYEEGVRRLRAKEELPPDVLQKAATLARKFVEDYHEKLEEKFIFPPFAKQPAYADLATTLQKQHDAGRRLTDVLLRVTTGDQFVKVDSRQAAMDTCTAYVRMYRPHEAREDTVLFPALYQVIGPKEVKELGEQFEEQEHRLFGDDGFQKAVENVAAIEKNLGIYDLAFFTPK
jgi:hemerythrin-like domain-containing protein